jgi:hypothetical protein
MRGIGPRRPLPTLRALAPGLGCAACGHSFELPADWIGHPDWTAYTNGKRLCFDGGKDGCLRICHRCFDGVLNQLGAQERLIEECVRCGALALWYNLFYEAKIDAYICGTCLVELPGRKYAAFVRTVKKGLATP